MRKCYGSRQTWDAIVETLSLNGAKGLAAKVVGWGGHDVSCHSVLVRKFRGLTHMRDPTCSSDLAGSSSQFSPNVVELLKRCKALSCMPDAGTHAHESRAFARANKPGGQEGQMQMTVVPHSTQSMHFPFG